MNAQENDALREAIPQIGGNNRLFLSQGIANLNPEMVAEILYKVKTFDDFTADKDPYGEHDLGEFWHEGLHIFWKIDDYEGIEDVNLVLTVMLAEEY